MTEGQISRPGDTFIPYPFAVTAKDAVVYHAQRGIHRAGADICALFGPSGSGKTEVIRRVMEMNEFKPYKGETGTLMRPVVFVEVATADTPRSVAIKVLEALDDPHADRGKTQSIIQGRAVKMLQKKGCRLLVFDEAQQLVSNKYDAGDFFRIFVNQPIVPVLLVGLPEVAAMITSNPQVSRRASPHIKLRPMNWFDPKEQTMFLGFLKGLQRQLPDAYKHTPLTKHVVAASLHIVSGGLAGRVSQVLRFSCDLAGTGGAAELTQAIFAEATDRMFELYNISGTNAFRLRNLPATW